MNKRPKIVNTIMFYFYGTILLILMIIFVSFNLAVTNHLESSLESQLNAAREKVVAFQKSDVTSQGMGRRAMFNQMMQEDTRESDVDILFLDSNRELTLSILTMTPGNGGQSTGGMGMGMGMHGSTNSAAEGYFMRVDPAAYREIMSVYDYVRAQALDLTNSAVVPATINGKSYYLKSIPFAALDGAPDYVLAFIGADMYTHFIQEAVKLLSLVMIPILLLTFFMVRYLAKRLAYPISRLQSLSGKLGSGDFQGEDFNLREQELADLNVSLNETAGKLSAYHNNQKVFFQNVSHELRTPLTSIRGYAEGIRYGVFDKDHAADVILNESLKLEKLVDDILYLSRLESSESLPEEKTSLDLSELLFEAREQVATEAAMNGISVEVVMTENPAIFVFGDELTRALVNLLSNGIRYAASRVVLEGSVSGGDLVIRVTDDGRGIEPGMEETIFKRFSKGAQGKHGIGLSITQAAVERHGGRVTAKNREDGQGAQFTVVIPLANLQSGK